MNLNKNIARNSSTDTKGFIICLVGIFLWSSTAIFIRYLTEYYQLSPLALAFWRGLIICVTLAGAFLIFNPKLLYLEKQQVRFLIVYGFILSVFNALWTTSVAYNGAAVATVLVYSSAAFTAVIGWRLFSESLGVVKNLVVVLSIVGCILVSGAYDMNNWQINPVGILIGLASGLTFASYSIMGRAASIRNINSWQAVLFSFVFATFFLLIYNILFAFDSANIIAPGVFWLGDNFGGWIILIILAIGPTIGGFGLYTWSLSYLPASVANLFATLEPPLTAVLAFVLLGEMFTKTQITGSALIIGGVLLIRFGEKSVT